MAILDRFFPLSGTTHSGLGGKDASFDLAGSCLVRMFVNPLAKLSRVL